MEMKSNLITGLLKEKLTSPIQASPFRPGQIFQGKITKLFPNGIAALQVGSQKIVAQLEAPLEANQKYWFQVQPSEGKTRLKVMGNVAENGRDVKGTTGPTGAPIAGLLKELSIPASGENMKIFRFFLKEQLPVTKGMVQQTAEWLKESSSGQAGLEAVKQMINKQLPMTKISFHSILAAMSNESLSQSLETLGNLLPQHSLTKAGNQLASFVQTISKPVIDAEVLLADHQNGLNLTKESLATASVSLHDHSTFTEYLKGVMKSIGFNYEHEMVQFLNQSNGEEALKKEVLKPLLIDFLNENPIGPEKEIAEKILHKITGLQLLAQESGPIQQFVVQLPVSLWQKTVDLTMQWSGRKQENGHIDPSFCRVLFYLELENLHDTIVDMQVQNRVMKITVMNENEQLKQLASPFIEQLRESLRTVHYTLSTVHFTQPSEQIQQQDKQQISSYFGSNHYSGVDLRI